MVGLDELAEVVINPSDGGAAGESGSGGGEVTTLAEVVDGVSESRNVGSTGFIGFVNEDVSVRFVTVRDGVGGAGDGLYEVAAVGKEGVAACSTVAPSLSWVESGRKKAS